MIELKPFTEKDFDGLLQEIDSQRLMMQWSGRAYKFPLTKNQLQEYLEMEHKKGSYILKAVDTVTAETVGHIALREIDRDHEVGRISYVLVYKNHRGKGIANKMFEHILHLAFHDLKLNRVSLGVFDFNKPAIACYENFGFQKEGLQRQVCKIGDEYWNNIEMSLLKSEWEQRLVQLEESVS